jgi:hypothetical protein
LRRKYGKRVLERGVEVKKYTGSVYYPEKMEVLGVGVYLEGYGVA